MAQQTPPTSVDAGQMGCIEEYQEWLRASGGSTQTARVRESYLRRLADIGPLFELTPSDMVHFLSRDEWAPETRKSARAALRGFYRWALETGKVDADPSRILPAVHVPAGKPRPTPDAIFAAALAVASRRDRLMLLLAAYAGLRRAEISGLHTRDIVEGELRILGKGGRVRMVPLHPDVEKALRMIEPGWVFPSDAWTGAGWAGSHLSADHVGATLRRLLGPGWTAHTLRHRFASRAYAADRDLRAVQELLGHSKPETTMRYTAVPDGAKRRAVDGVG